MRPRIKTQDGYNDALRWAARQARQTGAMRFVVRDDDHGHAVIREDEIETFYNGCEILAAFGPDGERID